MRLVTLTGSPGPPRGTKLTSLQNPSCRSPLPSLSHTGLIYDGDGDVDDTSYHWQPSHTVPGFLSQPSLPFGPYPFRSLVVVPAITTHGLGSGDGFTLLSSSTASYLLSCASSSPPLQPISSQKPSCLPVKHHSQSQPTLGTNLPGVFRLNLKAVAFQLLQN